MALFQDHVHIFANIPPHIKISEFVQKAKGRSSKRIQEEFPILNKKYWGKHLWGRGYFSSTSGNVTDDMINEYTSTNTLTPMRDRLYFQILG